MANPVSAELYVSAFNPTGNPGEYTIDSAVFNNQSDSSGNGAYDVQVGFVLYVPAMAVATAMPIPGVLHRYRFTAVEILDSATINGTLVWDESGDEEDSPISGCSCLLAETTPNRKLGLLPDSALYPAMPLGAYGGALRVDVKSIHDTETSGGGTGGVGLKSFTFSESLEWVIQHNQGTRRFLVSLWDSAGKQFHAATRIIDDNSFAVDLTEATAGTVDVVFG